MIAIWCISSSIGALTAWAIIPTRVSAGLFHSSVSASVSRSETLQTLPILQAKLSPMLLTSVGGPEPVTDDDVLSPSFSFYDLENVFVPERETVTTYTVQRGDTISAIAEEFGVSTNTIRWANNIPAKGTISVGQKLTILPITGVRHKVQRGDTISGIAKKYKADANEIADYNSLENGQGLIIGTTIIVPDGEITYSQAQIATVAQKTGTGKQVITKQSAPSGYFIRPVKGIKTQGFHGPFNAVDIGAPVGTPIVASAAGVVVVAKPSGWNGGYGGLTIIQHDNGSQSLYAHQSKIFVSVGDQVSQGEHIGNVGNTGRSTGPHLHLEYRGIKTPILY